MAVLFILKFLLNGYMHEDDLIKMYKIVDLTIMHV